LAWTRPAASIRRGRAQRSPLFPPPPPPPLPPPPPPSWVGCCGFMGGCVVGWLGWWKVRGWGYVVPPPPPTHPPPNTRPPPRPPRQPPPDLPRPTVRPRAAPRPHPFCGGRGYWLVVNGCWCGMWEVVLTAPPSPPRPPAVPTSPHAPRSLYGVIWVGMGGLRVGVGCGFVVLFVVGFWVVPSPHDPQRRAPPPTPPPGPAPREATPHPTDAPPHPPPRHETPPTGRPPLPRPPPPPRHRSLAPRPPLATRKSMLGLRGGVGMRRLGLGVGDGVCVSLWWQVGGGVDVLEELAGGVDGGGAGEEMCVGWWGRVGVLVSDLWTGICVVCIYGPPPTRSPQIGGGFGVGFGLLPHPPLVPPPPPLESHAIITAPPVFRAEVRMG